MGRYDCDVTAGHPRGVYGEPVEVQVLCQSWGDPWAGDFTYGGAFGQEVAQALDGCIATYDTS